MAPQLKFYDWSPSPFCFKVRAILDHKNLSYERINPLGAAMFHIRRRGKVGKVPALEIDGEMFVDSTDIAHELEKRFPDPPIIPAPARERALCHALEDWADESLYFLGLYFQWIEPEGSKMVPTAFGSGLTGRLACRYYRQLIGRQVKGQGTLRKPAAHVHRDLERQLDAIESLVEPGPYLLGDQPYLCDFALLGQLLYLARTPVGARMLQHRAAIDGYRSRMKDLRRANRKAPAAA
jgi:glutathione S-transferase